MIGNNRTAIDAALQQANREGLHAEIAAVGVQGEARDAGLQFASRLRDAVLLRRRPFCLVVGGETTVAVDLSGKGGRNQELALAAVDALDGLRDACLVALATDGEDGPTDAAGAVVTGETCSRAADIGMVAGDYLRRHDAYPFFAALGDLLQTGCTGTNVNDLMVLFGL